jgi:bifunctional non-homologous end joining protein LigD
VETSTHASTHGPVTSCGTLRDRQQAALALEALAPLEHGNHRVTIGRTRLRLSNVHKLLYPAAGWRKLDVLRYYATVAPAALTHLRGRALTMKRYPDGVEGSFFYQKQCPDHSPPFVQVTDPIGDTATEYCMAQDVRTLLWAANLADLELHVPLARAAHPQRPTHVAFDLDPGDGAGIVECCRVALLIRRLLQDLDLEGFPKTSGSKGMQVYVPLNRPDATFELTRSFAHAVARLLEREHRGLVVSSMPKERRAGKVLVDWSQNHDHKTTVCAYSLRALREPTVSTPLHWSEVEDALAGTPQTAPLRFTPAQVVDRLDAEGDLFEPVLRRHQQLPVLR